MQLSFKRFILSVLSSFVLFIVVHVLSSRSKILINLALFPTPSKMAAENLLSYLHTV